MSDGMSAAEAIEASNAREEAKRGALAVEAYRKYGGLGGQPTSEDYWREAFICADEVAQQTKPAPVLLEEKAALALEHTRKLLILETLGKLNGVLEQMPTQPKGDDSDDGEGMALMGTALELVHALRELAGGAE